VKNVYYKNYWKTIISAALLGGGYILFKRIKKKNRLYLIKIRLKNKFLIKE
jgi:hypothetical protein